MIRKIGRDVSAAEYWCNENAGYASQIDNAYHAHRLGMVRSLVDTVGPGGTVVDFGCGDGVMLLDFDRLQRIGIEPDAELLKMARERVPDATFIQGAVDGLQGIASESVDLILCLNVAAYFSDEEDTKFYQESARILRAGGALVITHSNELFDLYTLNSFTVEFFRKHFETDPSPLLGSADKPDRLSYNIRENPLHYRHKLARFGLSEERQGFSNHHPTPPLLEDSSGKGDKEFLDTLAVAPEEQWKLMFTCSTFGSRSTKRP